MRERIWQFAITGSKQQGLAALHGKLRSHTKTLQKTVLAFKGSRMRSQKDRIRIRSENSIHKFLNLPKDNEVQHNVHFFIIRGVGEREKRAGVCVTVFFN